LTSIRKRRINCTREGGTFSPNINFPRQTDGLAVPFREEEEKEKDIDDADTDDAL